MTTIRTFVIFVLLSALLMACGPSIRIIPLRGEGPEIVALIGEEGDLSDETPAVVSSKRLHRLLKRRQVASFWDLLTPQTKQSLEKLASHGEWNALEMLDSTRFTNPKDPEGPSILVDVEALFFVREPVSFDAVGEESATKTQVNVRVQNGAGHERLLVLHRIADDWYLHHTDFTSLPAIPVKPVPLLPGKYQLKKSEAATPSPSNEPDVSEETAEKPLPKDPAPTPAINRNF